MENEIISRYINLIRNISNAALCLQDWAENHGEMGPEEVTWAHVGSAQKILEDVREICRFAGVDVKEV